MQKRESSLCWAQRGVLNCYYVVHTRRGRGLHGCTAHPALASGSDTRFYPKTQLSWLARLDHSHCNSADPLTDGLEGCCVLLITRRTSDTSRPVTHRAPFSSGPRADAGTATGAPTSTQHIINSIHGSLTILLRIATHAGASSGREREACAHARRE